MKVTHFNVSDFTIIHFDAHMDLRDSYLGEKYSHATVMRRIFDMNPKELIQIGVRSASADEASYCPGGKNKDIQIQ